MDLTLRELFQRISDHWTQFKHFLFDTPIQDLLIIGFVIFLAYCALLLLGGLWFKIADLISHRRETWQKVREQLHFRRKRSN